MRLRTKPTGPLAFDLVDEESGGHLGRVRLPLWTSGSRVRAAWTHERDTRPLVCDVESSAVRVEGAPGPARYFVRPRGAGIEIRDRWRRVGRARIVSRRSGAVALDIPDGLSHESLALLALAAHLRLDARSCGQRSS